MATVDENMGTDEVAPDVKTKKTSRSTRRQLLKLAGATLAGAAGGAALKAAPALAYDGQTVTIGSVHGDTIGSSTGAYTTFTYGTALFGGATTNGIGVYGHSYPGGLYAYGLYGRNVGLIGTGAKGSNTGFGIGVWGNSGSGTGVYGLGYTGVWGRGTGQGVYAYTGSTNSRALYAYTAATGSVAIRAVANGGLFSTAISAINNFSGIVGNGGLEGVVGYSKTGYGVVGVSVTGIDIKADGSGRLAARANITGGIGAPTFTPSFSLFETVRDSYGGMWISRNQGSGQSAWKKVNAIRADSDDGAGTAYKPFRLLDTRSGKYNGVITPADKGPFATGHFLTFTVAGTGAGKSHVPADAAAVFGNLTVTGFSGSGWLTIAPAGAGTIPTSDPSSVNFGPGVAPAIANSFFVGLGTGGGNAGKVTVYVEISSGASVNFLVDITGYSH